MNLTITLTRDQWRAVTTAAQLGIRVADLIGPDDSQFFMGEAVTARAHEALATIEDHEKDLILKRRHTPPVAIEPELFPLAQAHQEGWTLDFDDVGGEHRIVAISPYFVDGNAGAERLVRGKAGEPGSYHEAAIAWLDRANILQHAGVVRSKVKLSEARR